MYNLERAPKNENNFGNKCISFSLPQHILKLVKALLRIKLSSSKEEEGRLGELLKSNLSILKQDLVLREVYTSLGWSEETKTFNRDLSWETVMESLQKMYDFNLKDLEAELSSVNRVALLNSDIENFHHKSNIYPVCNIPVNNNNQVKNFNYQTTFNIQENSLSSVIKSEPNEDPFKVEKPVPVNQAERHGPEHYESFFLTNSGKAWTQEDESKFWSRDLNSKLLPGSNQNTSLNNKTPSFHQDEEDSGKQTNFSFKDYNLNKKNPFPFRDFRDGFMNEYNNENRISSSFSLTSKNGNTSQDPYLSFKSNKASVFNPNQNLQSAGSGIIYKSALLPTGSKYIQNFGSERHGYELEKTNNINTSIYQDRHTQKKRGRKKKDEKLKLKNKINEISVVIEKKASKKNRGRKLAKSREILKKCKETSTNNLKSIYFGLKEISKKVKEIVKKYKKASYKQISDLIVNEINEKDTKDEKNIRRRIYDSLNVMKAMNLFKKDSSNKCILWNGTNDDEESDDSSFSEHSNYFLEQKYNLQNNCSNNLNNFSFKKRNRNDSRDGEFQNELKTSYQLNKISKKLKSERKLQEQEFIQEKMNLIKCKKQELETKIITGNLLKEQYDILNDLIQRNKEDQEKVKDEDKIKFPFIIIEFPENRSTSNNVNN